jgi:cob(I)alamin adenosyltransferase
MRITKVYTKTGDKGKTRLAGGQVVWKDNLRVEAYGTVDELNAAIGMVRAMCETTSAVQSLQDDLRWTQNKLFDIGGLLATAPGQSFNNMPQVTAADTARLERLIDRCQIELAPLKEFILPGGGTIGSQLHVARTICRRAERRCVSLMRNESVLASIVIFLNRLSDALFVLARWVAKEEAKAEVYWQREIATDRSSKKEKPHQGGHRIRVR